jgi:hypothetical protein
MQPRAIPGIEQCILQRKPGPGGKVRQRRADGGESDDLRGRGQDGRKARLVADGAIKPSGRGNERAAGDGDQERAPLDPKRGEEGRGDHGEADHADRTPDREIGAPQTIIVRHRPETHGWHTIFRKGCLSRSGYCSSNMAFADR